jgi:hypothetical protein
VRYYLSVSLEELRKTTQDLSLDRPSPDGGLNPRPEHATHSAVWFINKIFLTCRGYVSVRDISNRNWRYSPHFIALTNYAGLPPTPVGVSLGFLFVSEDEDDVFLRNVDLSKLYIVTIQKIVALTIRILGSHSGDCVV